MAPGNEAARLPSGRVGMPVFWLGLVATTIVLVVGSAIAYLDGLPSLLQSVPQLDKVCHFGVFGSLAFFLDGVLKRRALRLGPVAAPLAAVFILTPAAIEEYLQRYSPNRTSSIWDFAADAAGVAVSIWLSRRVS